MNNPTIAELNDNSRFELIAKLNHKQIKEFVINQLSESSKLTLSYMIYQIVMILTGLFFFTRSIVLALRGELLPLYSSLTALVFSFSFLIIVHELLHGVALKVTGAKNIHFGGYLKKFIFYAEADRHVISRKQFALIALTPLVVVKIVTLIGVVLFLNQPVFYFLIFVMSAHSLFCAGDIGLLSIFYKYNDSDIFTYDVKAEKTSYYFRKKQTFHRES
ncbi:MAG: DUF3267 domain-containing protein [Prolixibacteraceae bacterium]|nr:DUF3267 domain-containing protein [Prolixibacteraceae bacterium]